jgi:hypothetical protein
MADEKRESSLPELAVGHLAGLADQTDSGKRTLGVRSPQARKQAGRRKIPVATNI